MAWSIADVARMSGVTSRTLRHYDEIGLLVPAYIGSNGHRYYEQAGLLRLQQILLMRELGLGLREIAAVLERQVDQVAALREHQRRLLYGCPDADIGQIFVLDVPTTGQLHPR
jgi:DNA-binding transcriptional MerR regulator